MQRLTPLDTASHPPHAHAPYRSTALRAPTRPLVALPAALGQLAQPVYGHEAVGPLDHDLTRNARDPRHGGEPIGERIVVTGRVLDDGGRPLPHTLVELWQANAAGRYVHRVDTHDAPLDPNFFGAGRCLTDAAGHYRFLTIKPGAYPWGNHPNAWRPQHIHLSLFGQHVASRLVTQLYFPGDPLLAFDPIFLGTPERARRRLVADFSLAHTEPGFALGYQFDIVLRGPDATRFEGAA